MVQNRGGNFLFFPKFFKKILFFRKIFFRKKKNQIFFLEKKIVEKIIFCLVQNRDFFVFSSYKRAGGQVVKFKYM